jgi:transposase
MLPSAMTDAENQNRFVCLRAEGWSFSRIAQELDVSKPTLIKWSRKFQFDIQNHRAILREQLREKWLSDCETRVNALGEQLKKVDAELANRNISDLTTRQLFYLAELLRNQIKQEIGPMTFSMPVTEIPNDEYIAEVQDWKP